MADRFPILAFQDRRGHSRVPSLLFVWSCLSGKVRALPKIGGEVVKIRYYPYFYIEIHAAGLVADATSGNGAA